MQELEKILEEIESKEFTNMTIRHSMVVKMNDIRDIIRKHMNDRPCSECSRRKFYQAGYRDGKTDGWIPVEERLPERTLDEKIKESYQKYLVFIDGVDGWDIDIAVYDFWNDKKWREAHDGYGEIENVIAWRPLPEPYRPERSMN